MDNISICIDDNPSPGQLKKIKRRVLSIPLGLYEGVPKTIWGRNFSGRLPDKITIFQKPVESLAKNNEEVRQLAKIVTWHEIAHHFGFSERGVRNLEKKWGDRFKQKT